MGDDTRGMIRRAAPVVFLFAVALLMSAAHVAQYNQFSPIDELRHVDYAMRVTEGKLVKLGDRLGQESIHAEACRGLDLPFENPPCREGRLDPRGFRDKGYQTASPHPPTYYLAVGLVGRAFEGVGLFHDIVDPMRLMGGVLVGLGLMLTYFAGLRLGVRKGPLLAACALVPTASAVLHSSATVNPDSASILAGGLVLLAAVRWEQGELSLPWLAGAGALATGLKFTNLLVVFAVAAWLVARSPVADRFYDRVGSWWRGLRGRDAPDADAEGASAPAPTDSSDAERKPRFVRAAAALTAAAVAVAAAWALFDRLRATIDPSIVPQNQNLKADGFPALGLIIGLPSGIMQPSVFTWFPPVDSYDPVAFVNTGVTNGRLFVFFLFAGAMLVACLRAVRSSRMLVLGAVTSVLAILGPPAFMLMNYFVSNIITDPSGRYGMSLFPIFVVVLAWWVRGRAATLALAGVAAAIWILQLVTILSNEVPLHDVG